MLDNRKCGGKTKEESISQSAVLGQCLAGGKACKTRRQNTSKNIVFKNFNPAAVQLIIAATLSDSATVPRDSATVPSDSATVPRDSATVPSDTARVPSDPTTVPSDSAAVPSDPTTVPSDPATVPSDSAAESYVLRQKHLI